MPLPAVSPLRSRATLTRQSLESTIYSQYQNNTTSKIVNRIIHLSRPPILSYESPKITYRMSLEGSTILNFLPRVEGLRSKNKLRGVISVQLPRFKLRVNLRYARGPLSSIYVLPLFFGLI